MSGVEVGERKHGVCTPPTECVRRFKAGFTLVTVITRRTDMWDLGRGGKGERSEEEEEEEAFLPSSALLWTQWYLL